jgi:hypothetical protein
MLKPLLPSPAHSVKGGGASPFTPIAFLHHPQKSGNLIFFGGSAEPWLTSDVSPLISLTSLNL